MNGVDLHQRAAHTVSDTNSSSLLCQHTRTSLRSGCPQRAKRVNWQNRKFNLRQPSAQLTNLYLFPQTAWSKEECPFSHSQAVLLETTVDRFCRVLPTLRKETYLRDAADATGVSKPSFSYSYCSNIDWSCWSQAMHVGRTQPQLDLECCHPRTRKNVTGFITVTGLHC